MTKNTIKQHTTSYEDRLLVDLKDPVESAAYLEAALAEFQEDGHIDALLLALRHLAQAQGGLTSLAQKTHLNRQALYRALSPVGNPRLLTLTAILHALGFRLTIIRARTASV